MPTNQSPWDGAERRGRPDADGPAAAAKVPFGRKDRAEPVSSNAAPPRRMTTAPPPSVFSVRENRAGAETNGHSRPTTVPDGSPKPTPRPLTGTQNQEPLAEPRPPLSSSSSSTPKKERLVGFNVQRRRTPLQGVATGRRPATAGGAPLPSSPSGGHRDRILEGKQANKSMPEAAACSSSSSPSVPPPPCLTVCEHQGATSRKDGVKGEARRRAATATRRSRSAKAPKCIREHGGCATTTASKDPAVARRGPLVAPDLEERGPESLPDASPFSNVLTPTAPSANVSATPPPGAVTAVTSVTSVTSRISTINLAGSSSPSSSSPSPTENCLVGETRLSGQDGTLQLDGGVEEELENACSDDDDSDCWSINGSSSTASITPLSGAEESMSLGAEDDREERPALVPSLFAAIAPTLYFSTAQEKVELLPADQRRLLRWKICTVTPNIVKHTIGRSHFKVTKKSHDWLGCWGPHMKSPCFKALGEHQKLNHFPGTFQIGRKDRLWRNLSKMQLSFGKREFGFFPRTFVLPQDVKLLRKAWEDGGARQKWIVKPPASARGIGIQVIHKWGQLPRKRPLLVQKYLHKPYLIGGNKFDLRIYVYVTCYDPLRVYIFSDGLVRFASCKYSSSTKTLGNKFMHLTNYSVNKKNSEYQSNSDDKACQGHKWTLKSLWQFLGSKGVSTAPIWEKIKDIVIKTIIGSEPYVNSLLKMHLHSPYSCHELFGFDIMLDEKLKPWLLEVNISPSLHSNTALDVAVKGQMIRDLLNLAGFRIPLKEDVGIPSSTSSLCVWTRERTKPQVSADEKVKRAFYLAQCYADQDFLSTVLDVLTPEDVRVLAAGEDELTRLGQFQRIFPSPESSRYLRFFECPRYLNVLLDQWERKFCSSRPKGIALLTALCEKAVHLGTSDPLHMWSKSSYISSFEPQKQNLVGPSRSRVVVSHQHHQHHPDDDSSSQGSDTESASVASPPGSPGPGSSGSSSACASPQPGLAQRFSSL
ncbi:tubulin polyglutamylase TTLL4 [Pseudoliparis swirei]|uniref:tubulin polyglutamylase TTLL4 n=1 Tax=Pseudoliparis swirei TaxID=2059687 RepID=UPI0024BDF7DB|nr:tubulin polyglutamylase TTLL4 [Pseudoliparis swirei]